MEITREIYNACVDAFIATLDDLTDEVLWDKWGINTCRLVQIVFEQVFLLFFLLFFLFFFFYFFIFTNINSVV